MLEVFQNRPLSNYSTFGIGGNAAYFVSVNTLEELKEALFFAQNKKLPYFILGNGSNVLFLDETYEGVVIHNCLNSFSLVSENELLVESGFSLSKLSFKTTNLDLTGLEFAYGIPATLGGAIFMNASAHNQAISDSLKWVHFLNEDGSEVRYKKDELEFSYRYSSFHKMKGVIVKAHLELKKDKESKFRRKAFFEKRKKSQPLNKKSIGCIFKNPINYSAGALIDECGLKGLSVGGAKVSSLHANFIVNENRASAKDVLSLMKKIKEEVMAKKKISLQEEIRILSLR